MTLVSSRLTDALAQHRQRRIQHALTPTVATSGALNLAVLGVKQALDDLTREVVRELYSPLDVCEACSDPSGGRRLCLDCAEALR